MPPHLQSRSVRYRAFVSYSHASDRHLGGALQNALQLLAKPWYREQVFEIFRDQTDLASSPHLWSDIEAALRESEFFVLLASPQSAGSQWVAREIDFWLSSGRPLNTLILVVTDGNVVWNPMASDFDRERSTAIPPALYGRYTEEPLWIDLRQIRSERDLTLANETFVTAIQPIAAALHRKKVDELFGEIQRQHRRTILTRNAVIAVLSLLLVVAGVAGMLAARREREAERERANAQRQEKIATEERDEARRQRNIALDREREAKRERANAQRQETIATEQRDEARRQRNVALARSLLSEAFRVRAHERDLAILLTLGSLLTDDTVEARSHLFSLVQADPHIAMRTMNTSAPATAVAFSNDGQAVAIGLSDGRFILWKSEGDVEPLSAPKATEAPVTLGTRVAALALDRDGTHLVAAGADGRAAAWKVAGWKQIGAWPARESNLESSALAVSANAAAVAVGTFVDGAYVRLPFANREIHITDRMNVGESIALDPEGRMVISLLEDDPQPDVANRVGIWSLPDGNLLHVLAAPENSRNPAMGVAMGGNGRLVAVGRMNGSVDLWSLGAQPAMTRVLHHEPNQYERMNAGLEINHVALSNDGRWLATIYRQRQPWLWDAATGIRIGEALPRTANAIAFAPDGSALAVATNDGVELFDLELEIWKRRACMAADRTLTETEWKSYLPGIPYRCLCAPHIQC